MIKDNLAKIKQTIPDNVQLVVVSKFRPIEQLMEVYDTGQRDFAENRVQEMVQKQQSMPGDIKWHMIGHLQSNKVKSIISFVHLIQSVDSVPLALEINRQAARIHKKADILLQVHIASEESKYGFGTEEIFPAFREISKLQNVRVCGLMGMATLTSDSEQIQSEFRLLAYLFQSIQNSESTDPSAFNILSMGMSSDFPLAIKEGSNLVRIGSKIFEPPAQ